MVRRRKKKSKIKAFVSLVAIAVILIALTEFTGLLRSKSHNVINIENGEYFQSITEKLSDKHIIGSRLFFRLYAKVFYGKKLAFIKSGTFEFSGLKSYPAILKTLFSDNYIKNAVIITIPEGFDLKSIKALLSANGLISEEKFDDVVANHNFGYDWEKDFPEGSNRLEGFLFPDTYYFSKEDDEIAIIGKMLERFTEKTAPYLNKIKKSDYSLYETITLASIIEKEGSDQKDFKMISSVFHNRLKRKDHLRFLQSCATVQYFLKEHKSVLSKRDIRTASPYNTYLNPGLPIGPIASPGEAAIEAAVDPADSDYLYFQNDKDGKLYFSVDYDEHLDWIKELQ